MGVERAAGPWSSSGASVLELVDVAVGADEARLGLAALHGLRVVLEVRVEGLRGRRGRGRRGLGVVDELLGLLDLVDRRLRALDGRRVEHGDLARLAQGADPREDRAEEDEREVERQRDREEDEDAELVEEDDLREEHGDRRADRRDRAGEHGRARVDERVRDLALARRRVRLHVGIREVHRVVHRKPDDDDDEDRLEGPQAPADDLEEAEHERRDHADGRRRDGRRHVVARRVREHEPREEERQEHVRDARRDEHLRDDPHVRARHVDHGAERVLRVRVVVVHPVVPLLRHAQADGVVALRRAQRRLDLHVVERGPLEGAVAAAQEVEVVLPPLAVHGPRREGVELLDDDVVRVGALEARFVAAPRRLVDADAARQREEADAVAAVDEGRRAVELERAHAARGRVDEAVVERRRVGRQVEGREAGLARGDAALGGVGPAALGRRHVLKVPERVEQRLDAVGRLDARGRAGVGRVGERARRGPRELRVDAVGRVDLEAAPRGVGELLGDVEELLLGRDGVDVEARVPLGVARLQADEAEVRAVPRQRVAVLQPEDDVDHERVRAQRLPLLVDGVELVEVRVLREERVALEGRRLEHGRERDGDAEERDVQRDELLLVREDEGREARLEEVAVLLRRVVLGLQARRARGPEPGPRGAERVRDLGDVRLVDEDHGRHERRHRAVVHEH
mmetsp:Transcript_26740/g.87483  ORF Transcript_26740/g.87483 Transcript_26740/m.87483 type:complete len:686 (+) Transcript_26740:132-2189(+)